MAYVRASSKNEYDITCYIDALDTNYSYSDRYVKWYYNNSYKGRSTISAYASSGGSFTATGLTPDTKYYIDAEIYNRDGLIVTLNGVATTEVLTVLPWNWWYSKSSGNDFYLTPDEWKAFCNRINEVRALNGLGQYGFTTSSTYIASGKPYFAWIWLQASKAIDDLGTGVASACLNVKSNDDIYAWYFENLRVALNNAI